MRRIVILAIIAAIACILFAFSYYTVLKPANMNSTGIRLENNTSMPSTSNNREQIIPVSQNESRTGNDTTQAKKALVADKDIHLQSNPHAKIIVPEYERILLNRTTYDMLIDTTTHKIYALSHVSGKGQLYVIDSLTHKILGNMSLGFFGYPIALNQRTGLAYVGDSDTHSIVAIDTHTLKAVGNATVGSGFATPSGIAIDEKTNTLYVVNFNDNYLHVVDGQRNLDVKDIPNVHSGPGGISVVFDEKSNTIYAADLATGFYIVNGTSDSVTEFLKVPSSMIALNHDLNKLYLNPDDVTNPNIASDVTTYDIASNRIVNNTPVYYGIVFMALDERKDLVYLTSQYYRSLTVFNGTSDKVVAVIPVGGQPQGVAVDPETGNVYVGESSSIVVVTPAIIKSYSVPSNTATSFSNLTVYASLGNSSTITGMNISLLKDWKVLDTKKTPATFRLENGKMYQLTANSVLSNKTFQNSTNYIFGGWPEVTVGEFHNVMITSDTNILASYFIHNNIVLQRTVKLGEGETDGSIVIKSIQPGSIEATIPAGCRPIGGAPVKVTILEGQSESNYWNYNVTLDRVEYNKAVLSTITVQDKHCNLVCIVQGIYMRMPLSWPSQ